MKVYVVTESWGNGESYEDCRDNYNGYRRCFLSKEKAINYINDVIKDLTAPHEYIEPKHDDYYEENVKYELEEIRGTEIESEIIRRYFTWDETKTRCDFDTTKAYKEIEKADIPFEILRWDMEISSIYGWRYYKIIEEDVE